MNEQQTLFPQKRLRRRNGRYCTAEQFRIERVYSENKRMRYEKEKYFRAWLASEEKASRLERELVELKNKIKNLL